MSDVTHILNHVQQSAPKAAEELLPLVYEELRSLAASRMTGKARQPTARAHDAAKRAGQDNRKCKSSTHFFTAAEARRRIINDNGRRLECWACDQTG